MRRLILLALLSAVTVSAQTPPPPQAPLPAFEVASVKLNDSNSRSASTDDRNGGFIAVNMALRRLVAIAYRLDPVLDRDRVIGPGWIDTTRFDIAARAPAGTPRERIPDLLRTLLAERFQMVARTETRDGPIYAMVLARADGRLGSQLTTSSLDCSKPDAGFFGTVGVNAGGAPDTTPRCGFQSIRDENGAILRGGGRSMAEIAKHLISQTNRPVVDRTGLKGLYDLVLQFTPEGMTPRTDGLPGPSVDGTSLFTALQEQLGLKLEPQHGPVEFLVIDRIERPTPN